MVALAAKDTKPPVRRSSRDMSQRAYQLQSFCSADTEMYLHRAQREHCRRHSSLAAFRSSVCSSGHAPLEPPWQLPPYRVAPQWPSMLGAWYAVLRGRDAREVRAVVACGVELTL